MAKREKEVQEFTVSKREKGVQEFTVSRVIIFPLVVFLFLTAHFFIKL